MTILLSFIWVVADATAQMEWEFLDPAPGYRTRVTGVVEVQGHHYLGVSTYALDPSGQSFTRLVHLGPQGDVINELSIWNAEHAAHIRTVIPGTGTDVLHLFGEIREQDGSSFLFHYTVSMDLEPLDSSRYALGNMFTGSMDNAIQMLDGTFILVGISNPPLSGTPPNHTVLIHSAVNTDSLSSVTLISNFLLAGRDVIEIGPDTILISCAGSIDYPNDGFGSLYTIKVESMEVLESWGTAPFTSPAWPTSGNTVKDQLHMIELSSGNLLISGSSGSGSNGYRYTLQKTRADGEHIQVFRMDTPADHQYPAIYRSSIMTADGNVLVAFMDHFQAWDLFNPTLPNKVQIIQLDTALNVLCNHTIDGNTEYLYYWVDRIMETADGGYLVMGAEVDISLTPPQFNGWARKFGPENCLTSMDELRLGHTALAYPNPGHDVVSISFSGSQVVGSTLRMFDGTGRSVHDVRMADTTVRVDASTFAGGIYMYQLISSRGEILTSGKWIKE